jgi:hypothetical protein
MKRNDGIAAIIRPAEYLRELGLGHGLRHLRHLAGGFAQGLFAFFVFGDVEKEARFFQITPVLLP